MREIIVKTDTKDVYKRIEEFLFSEDENARKIESKRSLTILWKDITFNFKLKRFFELKKVDGECLITQKKITINIPRKFIFTSELYDYIGEKIGTKEKDEIIWKLIKDVTLHELGHISYPYPYGNGCPMTMELSYTIYNSVAKAVESLYRTKNFLTRVFELFTKSYGLKIYTLNNMFRDIVNNANITYNLQEKNEPYLLPIFDPYLCGIIPTYEKWPPSFSFFVGVQEKLLIDEDGKKLLEKFYRNKEKVDEECDELLKEMSLTEGIENLESNHNVLINKNEWPRMAEIFSRRALKFL